MRRRNVTRVGATAAIAVLVGGVIAASLAGHRGSSGPAASPSAPQVTESASPASPIAEASPPPVTGPVFKGVINGFQIDPDFVDRRTGLEACPGVGFTDPEPSNYLVTVVDPGPLSILPRALPEGLHPFGLPYPVLLCQGELKHVSWSFSGMQGAGVEISRSAGLRPVARSAARDDWIARSVAGRRAVAIQPKVTLERRLLGPCYVAVYDAVSDVFSEIVSESLNTDGCLAVAESLFVVRPVPGACPLSPSACAAASDISTAVTAGTSLESRLRTSRETCPAAGQGAGGPLPLCDGAAAGEVREGVLELGDSTRFVRSATETAALLQSVADPTKSQSFAWRPATIACTPADPGCEHCLLLVFVPTTANMQGLQPTLAFDVSIEGGVWTIERLVSFYTQLRAMVAPIVTGGTLANPPHAGLIDFLTYHPWAPPQ